MSIAIAASLRASVEDRGPMGVLRWVARAALFYLASVLVGCGGGGSSPPPAPQVQFNASASNDVAGQPITLTWSSTNTTGCTASDAWSGSEPTSGSTQVTPSAAGTASYSLSCTGAGGSQSANVSIAVSAAVPQASIAQTTVDPLAPIAITVSNDNPSASYSAQVVLASKVTYAVPLGSSDKGALTLMAPPGVIADPTAPAFSAGSFTVAIGWPDSTNTIQYGAPITLQVNALPIVPSTVPAGTAYLTLLKATKRLQVQGSSNLLSIATLAPSVSVGAALQKGNSAAQSIDAMISLITQVQANPSVPVTIGTVQGQTITLSGASLGMLDQLALTQLNTAHVLAPPASIRATRYYTEQIHLAPITQPRDVSGSSCTMEDVTCWTGELAAGGRNSASALGKGVAVVCYVVAGVALLSGAGELAIAAGLIGTGVTFATTAVGTALSVAIQGGGAAIANGRATLDDLKPSVDYFLTGIATNALTALGELGLAQTPTSVQVAYDAAQAANNADGAYNDLTAPVSNAIQSGQIPSSPPPADPYSATMTQDSSTNNVTVNLNPPPAGTTSLNYQQSDAEESAYITIPVTATNGTATFNAPPLGTSSDITVSSLSTPNGSNLATTDYDAGYPSTSDTTSFPSIGSTLSGPYSGSWSWSGPSSVGCTADDSGGFTATLTATSTSVSGSVSLAGVHIYNSTDCSVITVDTDTGSLSGTVSGTAVQFSMDVSDSYGTLSFTGTGTLTGNSLQASIVRSTGGSGQISASAQ